ncbi:gag-pol polyprotein [Trichonephila clavipes]|nr:gag-pol polyprotein [Trichonephila clavipes]
MLRLNSLEAGNFILCTDHKPLTYAFKQKLDKCSPRQARQLDFISQFTTDIRHIKDSDNLTAETLSRVASIHMPNPIDYNEIAKAQENDSELISLINNPQGWVEAVPIPDITAKTVAGAFFKTRIALFATPSRITTDQGRQFESLLFKALAHLLGIKRIRSSPYDPRSNGMIKEWHRPLKAALKAYNTEHWSDALPAILVGFRTVYKEDLQSSSAELVYGTTIRLPGEFFDSSPIQLAENLKSHFDSIRPSPASNHSKRSVFVHPALKDCSHVFIRNDTVRKPLQAPYDGPFKIFHRTD